MTHPRAGSRFLRWRFGKSPATLWLRRGRQFKQPKTFFSALEATNFSFPPEGLPCFHKHLHFCILKASCLLFVPTCQEHPRPGGTHGEIPHAFTSCVFSLACTATASCMNPDGPSSQHTRGVSDHDPSSASANCRKTKDKVLL